MLLVGFVIERCGRTIEGLPLPVAAGVSPIGVVLRSLLKHGVLAVDTRLDLTLLLAPVQNGTDWM